MPCRQVNERNGQLILVKGGLASGKTYILNDLSRYAAEAGAIVLTATCALSEQNLQAGVVEQLFSNTELPPELDSRMSGTMTMDVQTPAQVSAGHQLVHPRTLGFAPEMCNVLLDLSKGQPIVICIDDIQFSDTLSLQMLLYLLRRMRSCRMLVVLSERQAVPIVTGPRGRIGQEGY